jgi:cytochrome b6-f complex iron-sulfur subunit
MAETTTGAGMGPSSGMTRREFLYYIWGASMAVMTAQFAGLVIWFALPRFREGEFGGTFTVPFDRLPKVNDPPANFPDGRFWLVNVDSAAPEGQERMFQASDEAQHGVHVQGVAAIYTVCTHLGCIYAWIPTNQRYECPCHGSKYRLDGRRIESPAPRDLDRFHITALDVDGNVLAASEPNGRGFFQPLIPPANTAFLRVDTGLRREGPAQTLLCEFAGTCP